MDSILKNLIRIGRVTKYHPDPKKHLVRVLFEDKTATESFWLPIIVMNTLQNKDYWMPDKGELVVCLFLPSGNAQGFILGSIYQEKDASPVSTDARRNVRYVEFGDGTFIEYNRETHTLTIDASGPINIVALGNVNVTGDVIADGISLKSHTHTAPDGVTSPPNGGS
ncbi:MAG: baseplate assembly protein [Desulfosporosinus sp. BRH_c37]|nr:MAG: baseplate assembly protein [Desulfosporosinus sp. BRH_c37]